MLHAAIILATDVSLDPNAPHAPARRYEVLAACELLESWQRESAAVVTPEGIQKCVQFLKALLQKKSGQETMQGGSSIGGPKNSAWPSTYVPTSEVLSIDRSPSPSSLVGSSPYAVSHAELRLSRTDPATNCEPSVASNADQVLDMPIQPQEWNDLWSDFFTSRPDMEMDSGLSQWNSMLDGVDLSIGSAFGSL